MTQEAATKLMDAFAERSGLRSDVPPQRYLWTDAFAVVNWLELYRRTQEPRFRELALALIDQVHATLGRHRSDEPNSGWLSGMSEEDGAAHPTAGGLRIGKPLPERGPAEPSDERLEWERDGQYFHYLTKWMDALARTGSLLGESRFHSWAVELAASVFPRFLQRSLSGEPLGLAWKMSIDLSRPQAPGMSPHDALDGYVTFRWLDSAASETRLDEEIATLRGLIRGQQWDTADPLGLGGLLLDAMRMALLPRLPQEDGRLPGDILSGVAAGLTAFDRAGTLEQPAERRLGFRELGLTIGLQGLGLLAEAADRSSALAEDVRPHLSQLTSGRAAGERILEFWSDERNRQNPTWTDHRDINDVMLATAMLEAQAGTAVLPPPR